MDSSNYTNQNFPPTREECLVSQFFCPSPEEIYQLGNNTTEDASQVKMWRLKGMHAGDWWILSIFYVPSAKIYKLGNNTTEDANYVKMLRLNEGMQPDDRWLQSAVERWTGGCTRPGCTLGTGKPEARCSGGCTRPKKRLWPVSSRCGGTGKSVSTGISASPSASDYVSTRLSISVSVDAQDDDETLGMRWWSDVAL